MKESTTEQQNSLVNYYALTYKKKYGNKPLFNRQSATWTFKSMLYDFSIKEIRDYIKFYINVYKHPTHDILWFGHNYTKVIEEKQKHDQQVDEFNRLKKESIERTRLWKERIERVKGNKSGTGEG